MSKKTNDFNHDNYIWFFRYKKEGIRNKKLYDLKYKQNLLLKSHNIEASIEDIAIQKEYNNIIRNNIGILHIEHFLYPKNVKSKLGGNAPFILFYKGNIELLKKKKIAIVGSRNASQKGLELAKEIAAKLSQKDVTIVSGYAKGIDESAHLGALKFGGSTIAVLPYGILQFRIKRGLKQNIDLKNNFLAISNFAPDDQWKAWRAMQRNKLVCSLSDGVIVIESGAERDPKTNKISGTYNAAKIALNFNIPLFVVDPYILPTQPEGNKELLKKPEVIKINPYTEDVISKILNAI